MHLNESRDAEKAKYIETYRDPTYRMGHKRYMQAADDIASVPYRTSYLDVGTGRGEMLRQADRLGFKRIIGTEVVDSLIGEFVIDDETVVDIVRADAWDLPFDDNEIDLVTMFDVIEHILPEDMERTCRELERVAARDVILTANNKISRHNGVDLHVNIMSYPEWDARFRAIFSGKVIWLRPGKDYSETWRISL